MTKKSDIKILKGRNHLIKDKGLDYLMLLSNKLVKIELEQDFKSYYLTHKQINECRRQFIIERIISSDFNEKLIYSFLNKKKKIRFGAPKQILLELEREGFRANTFCNKLRWYLKVFFWFSFGIYTFFEVLLKIIFSKKNYFTAPFAYFNKMSAKNFAPNSNYSNTVFEWFIDIHKESIYTRIDHDYPRSNNTQFDSIEVKYNPLPIYKEFKALDIASYCVDFLKIILVCIAEFSTGKFLYSLILKEMPLVILSNMSNHADFADKYLFHNTSAIFRPLWTYIAEKNGKEVIMYFYSQNNTVPKSPKGRYYKECDNREFMSWSKYYVWNNYQRLYLESTILNKNFTTKIVGPIPFHPSAKFENKTLKDKKLISIFEVTVFNPFYNAKIGHPYDYISPTTLLKFHKDIKEVLNDNLDFIGVMKPKRESYKIDKDYLNNISKLYDSEKMLKIDVNTDPESLINSSFAVISIPFTSPAFIAKFNGVPTVYYDPIGFIQKDDRSLSGIKLIQSKEELNLWLNSLI